MCTKCPLHTGGQKIKEWIKSNREWHPFSLIWQLHILAWFSLLSILLCLESELAKIGAIIFGSAKGGSVLQDSVQLWAIIDTLQEKSVPGKLEQHERESVVIVAKVVSAQPMMILVIRTLNYLSLRYQAFNGITFLWPTRGLKEMNVMSGTLSHMWQHEIKFEKFKKCIHFRLFNLSWPREFLKLSLWGKSSVNGAHLSYLFMHIHNVASS